MTLDTRRDRFDKADAAFQAACAEVNQSYMVWSDACERLMRVGKERLAAWGDLVEPVLSVDGEITAVPKGER